MKNLVVFASGSGSNFQSIIDAISDGDLNARITGLVSNKENAFAVNKAAIANIDVRILNENNFDSENEYASELLIQLKEWNADVLILAGYLKKIPLQIIQYFEGRILNIHPSLLPKFGGKGFYGMNVHKAVIENKETVSGCTVHIVTEEYDEGPVIAQAKVGVSVSDTAESLAKKVLKEEHKLYPKAIQQYLKTLK